MPELHCAPTRAAHNITHSQPLWISEETRIRAEHEDFNSYNKVLIYQLYILLYEKKTRIRNPALVFIVMVCENLESYVQVMMFTKKNVITKKNSALYLRY